MEVQPNGEFSVASVKPGGPAGERQNGTEKLFISSLFCASPHHPLGSRRFCLTIFLNSCSVFRAELCGITAGTTVLVIDGIAIKGMCST